MSFSRPDPSSPTSIADASFGTSRRGFDQAEVRDFLRMVAAEFGRLRERERFLEHELQAAQSEGEARGPLDEEAMIQVLGEESVRMLTTARESANEIRAKAEQAAAQLLSEAGDDATRVREEADIEASRRRADAAADAEAELSMAKQQGREMVNEARAYRERVLSELARRRELAREQIEQLVHGRDRLTQAFERARLVAVDVVAEMQPLGEPEEYVNLTPTTGPLPVMIANSPRPADDGDGVVAGVTGKGAQFDDADHADDVDHADGGAVDHADDVDHAIAGAVEPTAAALATTADRAEGTTVTDIGELRDAARRDDSRDDDLIDVDSSDPESSDDGSSDDDLIDVDSSDDGSSDDDLIDVDSSDDDSSDPESSDDGSSDVVVDLFARLRADAEPEPEPDDQLDVADVAPDVPDLDTADADADVDTADAGIDADADADADVDTADAGIDADADADADLDVERSVFEARDEVITPLIVSSAKKLKRALADEQNDVLDALRRGEVVHDLDALLPTADEHAQRYIDAIADDLLDAVHEGSATSRTTSRKIRQALARESVGVANDALAQWLVTPLRDRLARCVADGEGDNAVVTKKVRAVYREWKTQRIDETLDDVMRSAHGRGVLAGFNLDTPIVWEVDQRFGACPDCEDNALAGAVAAGGQFPTGDSFAPAHQGCRCLLAAADG